MSALKFVSRDDFVRLAYKTVVLFVCDSENIANMVEDDPARGRGPGVWNQILALNCQPLFEGDSLKTLPQ